VDRIDSLILIFLGGAATVYLLMSTIALLLRRELIERAAARETVLFKQYTRRIVELVLRDVPPLEEDVRRAAARNYCRSFLDPLKKELSLYSSRKRAHHREFIRIVIADLAEDLTGEAYDRIVFFAEELGLPRELLAMLSRREWWLRATAARNLGTIKALDAADALIDRLKDRHQVVRHQASIALIKILGASALRPIFWTRTIMNPWERIELSVAIAQFGSEAAPYLLEALESTNRSIVVLATEMLGSQGLTSSFGPLVTVATQHRDPKARAAAIASLGELGDQRAVEPLAELLKSRDPAVRGWVLESLGSIGSSAAIPRILERLQSGDLDEKIRAALALGRCGVEGERELRILGGSDDPEVRDSAFNALEELGLVREG